MYVDVQTVRTNKKYMIFLKTIIISDTSKIRSVKAFHITYYINYFSVHTHNNEATHVLVDT